MKKFINRNSAASACALALLAGGAVQPAAAAEELDVAAELKAHFSDKKIRGVFNANTWHYAGQPFTLYVSEVRGVKVDQVSAKVTRTDPLPQQAITVPIAATVHINCLADYPIDASVGINLKYEWGHSTEVAATVSETTEVEADIFAGDGMVDVRQSVTYATTKGHSDSWSEAEAEDSSETVRDIKSGSAVMSIARINQIKQPDYLTFDVEYFIPDDATITLDYFHIKDGRHLGHTNKFRAGELKAKGVLPQAWKTSGRTKFTMKQLGTTFAEWHQIKPEFVPQLCHEHGNSQAFDVDLNAIDDFIEKYAARLPADG